MLSKERFESYVILDRSKTFNKKEHTIEKFESYVILDRSKTSDGYESGKN